MWWFPEIRVSPNQEILNVEFSLINHPASSSYWGTPMAMGHREGPVVMASGDITRGNSCSLLFFVPKMLISFSPMPKMFCIFWRVQPSGTRIKISWRDEETPGLWQLVVFEKEFHSSLKIGWWWWWSQIRASWFRGTATRFGPVQWQWESFLEL